MLPLENRIDQENFFDLLRTKTDFLSCSLTFSSDISQFFFLPPTSSVFHLSLSAVVGDSTTAICIYHCPPACVECSKANAHFSCLVLCITTVYSPRSGARFHKQNTLRFNNKYTRLSITVKLSKCNEATKTTKTPAKDKYANPKNKMELQAHDNNEYAVQQQGTEYRTISKDKTHRKMLKTNENNNIKKKEGRVQGDLRIRCQNRTGSPHTHVLCTQSAKASTHKSKRTVSAVRSRTQLLAHIENNSAQPTNYDTSPKLNSRTANPQLCIQQINITYNYSNSLRTSKT